MKKAKKKAKPQPKPVQPVAVAKKSIQDLMTKVMEEAEVGKHGVGEFCRLSIGHAGFFGRLLSLGWERGGQINPIPPNVYEASKLSEAEYQSFLAEFRVLQENLKSK
jgi:hypothetical protein